MQGRANCCSDSTGCAKAHLSIGQQRGSRVGPGAHHHRRAPLVWNLHREMNLSRPASILKSP